MKQTIKKSELRNLVKEVIKEEISKRRLNEDWKLDKEIEDTYYSNAKEIKKTMKDYGFKLKDLKTMNNYMDFANIMGMDSEKFKGSDVTYYGNILYGLITNK